MEKALSREVANISAKGLWLLIDQEEHFLSYDQFPWFREARVSEILQVTRPSSHHLYWPELDIDLAVESIVNPELYPLISSQSGKGLQKVSDAPKVSSKRRVSDRSSNR